MARSGAGRDGGDVVPVRVGNRQRWIPWAFALGAAALAALSGGAASAAAGGQPVSERCWAPMQVSWPAVGGPFYALDDRCYKNSVELAGGNVTVRAAASGMVYEVRTGDMNCISELGTNFTYTATQLSDGDTHSWSWQRLAGSLQFYPRMTLYCLASASGTCVWDVQFCLAALPLSARPAASKAL